MTNYLANDEELTDVADAIRTKGGTSASLEWPDGFISAIGNISGGGATYSIIVNNPEGTLNRVMDMYGNEITSAVEGQTILVSAERMTYKTLNPVLDAGVIVSYNYDSTTLYEMPASDLTVTFGYA